MEHSIENIDSRWREPEQHLVDIPDEEITLSSDRHEAKRRAKALRAMQCRQARKNPNAFIEYAIRDKHGNHIRQAWYHEEWQDAISNHQSVFIMGPRRHGKTTQIVGRIVWELGNDPSLRIKIVCQNDSKAAKRLYEVQQHIESNPRVADVFPNLRPAEKGRWNNHQLYVHHEGIHREPSVEAFGVESSASGDQADLLIADDVVDRRNALGQPKKRKVIIQAWESDWENLLNPDSRVIYICTLWHRADLSHKLRDSGSYHVLDHSIKDEFHPIWPEVWSCEELIKRKDKIRTIEFNRGFRNVVTDDDEALIKYDSLHWYEPKEVKVKNPLIFRGYDLAMGKNAANSMFACVTLVVDPDEKRIYVHHGYEDRIPWFPAQVRRTIKDHKALPADSILIESVNYQRALGEQLAESAPELLGLIQAVYPLKDKGLRLQFIAPLIESGKILFSQSLNPQRKGAGLVVPLVEQITDYPVTEHDDLMDAFVMAVIGAKPYVTEIDDDDDYEEDEIPVRIRTIG